MRRGTGSSNAVIQFPQGLVQFDDVAPFDLLHRLLETLWNLGIDEAPGMFKDLPALFGGKAVDFVKDLRNSHLL